MRRFFVPVTQIYDSSALISGEEFHHLRHVLRLQVGDNVTLRDDQGKEHHGTITAFTASAAEVTISQSKQVSTSHLHLTLALGLLKGQKMDLVIEKVTELGVDRIAPFTSTFTISQLPTDRQSDRLSRWQRIAQSAAKQSGSIVPRILAPQTFVQLCDSAPSTSPTLLLYEHERAATLKAFAGNHSEFSALCVIVGPEGGFAVGEIERAREVGIHVVRLGPHILRSETASIIAVALCRFLWD
jgi:16S rRNA (uracil1498-N3)-methyltransferase